MDTNSNELFQNRPCNECNSSDNVEIITIGKNGIALCMKCRNKLRKILGIEQPIGIELRNINLTGLTLVDELLKADEEEKEFEQALKEYLKDVKEHPKDRHEVSREHLLEELCDTIQVKLSTMKTIDIDIEEITEYWNTKHLEKIKDRPRKKKCSKCTSYSEPIIAKDYFYCDDMQEINENNAETCQCYQESEA